MQTLSRAVLVIGTLAASASIAEAGNKAAFNAPLRDAMPDIAPLEPKPADVAPVPSAAAVAAAPVAATTVAGHHHRAVARLSAKTDRANRAGATEKRDTVEAKTAAGTPMAAQSEGVAAVAATGNVEPAAQTPGPPPAAHADGPREAPAGTVAELLAKHAEANGVPLKLARAVVTIESRGNAHASNAGALGLMQIKFGTARAVGFSGPAVGLFVADTNLRYGMKILGDAYRAAGGDTCGALMRYQSGHLASRMSHANVVYCSRARAIMAGL